MKKSFQCGIIAVVFAFVPLFANASWWNPIDWLSFVKELFSQKTEIVYVQVPATTTPIVAADTPSTAPMIASTSVPVVKVKAAAKVPAVAKKSVVQQTVVASPAVIPLPVPAPAPAPVVPTTTPPLTHEQELERESANENAYARTVLDEQEQQKERDAATVAAQKAIDDANAPTPAQIKQAKLDAINLQIANLNAKYAKDGATINSTIETVADFHIKMDDLRDQYDIDYATLMAEYQQIEYSN